MSAADDEEEVDAGWIDDFLQESREDAPMQPYLIQESRIKKPHKTSVGRRGSKKSKKARCAAAASLPRERASLYQSTYRRGRYSDPVAIGADQTLDTSLTLASIGWCDTVGQYDDMGIPLFALTPTPPILCSNQEQGAINARRLRLCVSFLSCMGVPSPHFAAGNSAAMCLVRRALFVEANRRQAMPSA